MKGFVTFLGAFAVSALLAGAAFAEAPKSSQDETSARTREERPRYANTAERWRGRPHLRSAATHPVGPTGSEVVYEHLPSVNFLLEGQHGGAFSVPRF